MAGERGGELRSDAHDVSDTSLDIHERCRVTAEREEIVGRCDALLDAKRFSLSVRDEDERTRTKWNGSASLAVA